jgi:small subunit ribosomal protein S6
MAEETVSVETTKYEMMMILVPDLGEDGTKTELDEIRSLITSHGGNIFHEDIWGNRELAYVIKKQEQGYYVVWNLDLPGGEIRELEKTLNINKSLLRYMLIKISQDYQFKSVDVYQEEYDAEQKRLEEEKELEKEKSAPKKKAVKEVKKEVKKPVEKKKAPVKEKEEAKEEAPKEEAKKDKLEDVDAKLKSIISDPDISL